MSIGQMQRAETAHGQTDDGAALSVLAHRQRLFHMHPQIAGQRRLVIAGTADIGGIHIPAVLHTGHDDDHGADRA